MEGGMFFKFNKKYLSLLVLFLSISFYSSAQLIDLDAEDNDVENIKSRTGEIRSEENFLGKGTYKEVFKFNWDDKGVAGVFFTFDDKGLTALTREVNFYNIYVHENLIKAFAYSKISRFIILELATNSLDKYFRNNKQIMGMEEKLNYFLDISKGLQYLHNNNVIHRDMKLANIVLVNDPEKKWFVAKLIDFDYSVKLNEFEVFEEGYSRGTTGYKAPEILKPFREIEEERDGEVVKISTYRYTRAVDVYALGNIFYILREINDFCKGGSNKLYLLEWEEHFLNAFKGDVCLSISKILNGLSIKLQSTKDSIKFIDLRNLVSHADDIEPEINTHKEIKFDKTFITNLLELMTIKSPRLLIKICEIKLN